MAYLKDPDNYKRGTSGKPERRLAWHLAFCREALGRGDAWITSTPNASVCRLETTPGSQWPAELIARGFPLDRSFRSP
jgi:hypothetical protein